jgi:hypothetical protein
VKVGKGNQRKEGVGWEGGGGLPTSYNRTKSERILFAFRSLYGYIISLHRNKTEVESHNRFVAGLEGVVGI